MSDLTSSAWVVLTDCAGKNSDIEIAKSQTPKPIAHLAAEIGIPAHDLELYGRYKAKVKLEVLDSLKHRQYVLPTFPFFSSFIGLLIWNRVILGTVNTLL